MELLYTTSTTYLLCFPTHPPAAKAKEETSSGIHLYTSLVSTLIKVIKTGVFNATFIILYGQLNSNTHYGTVAVVSFTLASAKRSILL